MPTVRTDRTAETASVLSGLIALALNLFQPLVASVVGLAALAFTLRSMIRGRGRRSRLVTGVSLSAAALIIALGLTLVGFAATEEVSIASLPGS